MENYRGKLIELTSKVIIYEFHKTFDEINPFEDSKYYNAFNDRLKHSENIQAMLEHYPVLTQMIDALEDNILRNYMMIIERYQIDHSQIENMLGYRPGKILKINTDMGDTHRDGESVGVVECENGMVMYKPRSLKADELYNKMITFFNERCNTNLRT